MKVSGEVECPVMGNKPTVFFGWESLWALRWIRYWREEKYCPCHMFISTSVEKIKGLALWTTIRLECLEV